MDTSGRLIAAGGLGAIVLAGGRASRMGGAAKPLLDIGGRSLLTIAIEAAASVGVADPIVVGPTVPGLHARVVREDPPFTGPVAAIGAALPWVRAERVLVLAADLPRADDAVTRLLAEDADIADGVCLRDPSGRAQWLTAIYRTEALRAALGLLPDGGRNASLRALVAGMSIVFIDTPTGLTDDVDTWEDLQEARATWATQNGSDPRNVGTRAQREEPPMIDEKSRTLPPEALEEWAAALRARFGLADEDLPISLILDLARDVAVSVARPAAPFSAFAAGLVAGRAGGDPATVRDTVAIVTAMAAEWDTAQGEH